MFEFKPSLQTRRASMTRNAQPPGADPETIQQTFRNQARASHRSEQQARSFPETNLAVAMTTAQP